jgi:hypothetical protein
MIDGRIDLSALPFLRNDGANTSSFSPPSNFTYLKSNYFFRINNPINAIVPQITGRELVFSITPSLPTGLKMDEGTGIITGTATSVQTSVSYTINASNRLGFVIAQINLTVVGLLPLKTGYTVCYDTAGSLVPCSGTGQDGEFQNGTVADFSAPTNSVTYPLEYITRDNLTGLNWITCAQGFSGNNCMTGGATLANWNNSNSVILATNNSLNAGLGYAGINTWRLPTISELERIHLPSASSPSIYITPFPNSGASTVWSVTNNPTNSADAMIVNFTGNGVTNILSKTSNTRIRYVSGVTESQILLDRLDDTILDISTGLVWQKCSFGLSGTSCAVGAASNVVWNAALTSCNGLNLAGYTWRLPNMNELKSVLDRSITPTLNPTFFPSAPSVAHWTSTSSTLTPNNAYRINFTQSLGDFIGKTATNNYKCVATMSID